MVRAPAPSGPVVPVERLVDRWLRAMEVPRFDGPVYLVTQTVHLGRGLVDVDSWAFEVDGGVTHRREYGHRSALLAMERRIVFGRTGLPVVVECRRRLGPGGHGYRQSIGRVRVERARVVESLGGARRVFEYDPVLDQLEHGLLVHGRRGGVVRWVFHHGGRMDRVVIPDGDGLRRVVGGWDAQNVQVWGVHDRAWRLEVVERDEHGNPVTGHRRYMVRDGDSGELFEDGRGVDVVTWEISYARLTGGSPRSGN